MRIVEREFNYGFGIGVMLSGEIAGKYRRHATKCEDVTAGQDDVPEFEDKRKRALNACKSVLLDWLVLAWNEAHGEEQIGLTNDESAFEPAHVVGIWVTWSDHSRSHSVRRKFVLPGQEAAALCEAKATLLDWLIAKVNHETAASPHTPAAKPPLPREVMAIHAAEHDPLRRYRPLT